MKKMMINGAMALAAALGNSFGGLLDVVPTPLKTSNRGKGRGRRLGQWNLYLKTSRPTDKRHWHNLNDHVQRDTLQAAEAKRARKAEKLADNTMRSHLANRAHDTQEIGANGRPIVPCRLHPFYVNRGEVV